MKKTSRKQRFRLGLLSLLLGSLCCGFWGCESKESRIDQKQLGNPITLRAVVEFKEGKPEICKPYLPAQFKVEGLTLAPAVGSEGYILTFNWRFGFPADQTQMNYMVDWAINVFEVNQEAGGRESVTELPEMKRTYRYRPTSFASQTLSQGKHYRFELETTVQAFALKYERPTVTLAKIDLDTRTLPKTLPGITTRLVDYPAYSAQEVAADFESVRAEEENLKKKGWSVLKKDDEYVWDEAVLAKFMAEHPTVNKEEHIANLVRFRERTAFFHGKYSGPYFVKVLGKTPTEADLKNNGTNLLEDPTVWVEMKRNMADSAVDEIGRGKKIPSPHKLAE